MARLVVMTDTQLHTHTALAGRNWVEFQ